MSNVTWMSQIKPFQGTPEQEEMLVRASKYSRLEGVFPVNMKEGESVVACEVAAQIVLVFRHLEDRVPLDGGKTFNKYSVWGLIRVGSAAIPGMAEEAQRILLELKEEYQATVLGELDGLFD